jgi:hypothetical protein
LCRVARRGVPRSGGGGGGGVAVRLLNPSQQAQVQPRSVRRVTAVPTHVAVERFDGRAQVVAPSRGREGGAVGGVGGKQAVEQ